MSLIYGLLTGVAFGFFLQKARVLRYEKQLGALRLMDMTIVKFMLSHIIVAMVGLYLLRDAGLVDFSLKATNVGANVLGGLCFGLGWGLFGYCPGTAVGALGEGRYGVIPGLVGMLAGASAFAHSYPALKATVYAWGDWGKLSLPEVTGLNQWLLILGVVAVYVGLLRFIHRKGL